MLLRGGQFRCPQLHRQFGLSPGPGLAEVLLRQDPIESEDFAEAVQSTSIPRLRIVTAGRCGIKLLSDSAGWLISGISCLSIRLRPHLPDACLISQIAGGVVMVCRAGETTGDQVSDSAQLPEDDGASVLGAILSEWEDLRTANPGYLCSYASIYFQRNNSLGDAVRSCGCTLERNEGAVIMR